MRFAFRDLFTWEGTIDRGTYAVVGVLGFALKHNLDRIVATFFGYDWGLFNYWIPLDRAIRLSSLSGDDALFLVTLVALSLPFIWVGVALTLKRLRSAGWPSWPVVFFFAPFVNLPFFILLSLVPARSTTAVEPRPGFLRPLIPRHPTGSAAVAVVITTVVGLAATLLSTTALELYGWGLFVALPFCLGLTAALLSGYHAPRTLRQCLLVVLASLALLAGAFVALAIEGVICIAMAAPIALPLALLGGWVGYLIQRRAWRGMQAPAAFSAVLLTIPAILSAEYTIGPTPPLHEVRTTLDLAAPPQTVWRHVVAFSEIAPPTEWYFRIGLAYPMRAEIHGSGPGAVRHCVFSTGAFVEPITAWEPPHRLAFSVRSSPPPMDELSFTELKPPHLEGFFVSRRGEFRMEPLPDGGTRVIGVTWYEHGLWPASYWRLWSDAVIHRIHLRVLRHIREQAEAEAGSSSTLR